MLWITQLEISQRCTLKSEVFSVGVASDEIESGVGFDELDEHINSNLVN
jgi:hypothetical protein